MIAEPGDAVSNQEKTSDHHKTYQKLENVLAIIVTGIFAVIAIYAMMTGVKMPFVTRESEKGKK